VTGEAAPATISMRDTGPPVCNQYGGPTYYLQRDRFYLARNASARRPQTIAARRGIADGIRGESRRRHAAPDPALLPGL